MKFVKIILMIVLVVFVGIQFIPTKRNQSENTSVSDFMIVYNVPKQIEDKIKVSCYDCHSNNTQYPWYNKVQPLAWLLENHIKEGKADLNFSDYGDYSKRRQKNKLKSIISQIRNDEMPIWSYTIIHNDAKISASNKEIIMEWFQQLKDSL